MTRNRTLRNTVLWTAAASLVLIGVIVFVSATGTTKKGEAIIENPGALVGIVITSLATLMGILLPILLRAEKNTEAVKEQVQNDHKKPDGSPLNLRDDMDDKHEAIMYRLESLQTGVDMAIRLSDGNASDIRGMRRDVGRVQDSLAENTKETNGIKSRITGLVRTVNSLEEQMKINHPEGESHE